MGDSVISIDLRALLFLVIIVAFGYFAKKRWKIERFQSALLFPSIASLKNHSLNWREKWKFLPKLFWVASMGAFSLAFLDPHDFVEEKRSSLPPSEGLAIYFALDHSGSMGEKTSSQETKLDLLKRIVGKFIQEDSKDLIGLVSFARKSDVLSPLTFDRRRLEEQLMGLTSVKDKTQDGTAIGYAIYKTAHLIASSRDYEKLFGRDEELFYEIKGAVIVVVTDGLQDPNALDQGDKYRSMELSEAALYAKDQGIRVYIVSVEPRINAEEFRPNKNEMRKAAEETGGKLIVAEGFRELGKALKEVQGVEMSRIGQLPEDVPVRKRIFYPYLTALGLLLMGVASILESTIWRRTA